VAKLGFVFAAMPFHAFFAVAVLSGGAIIGLNYYSSLDLVWQTDLAADQQVGGQIAWATGELPLLIIIVALVGQWFRSDQRESRRRDRAVKVKDDELDAYNAMLAELDRRETTREAVRDDRS
jgi:putative copper resistance protein D